MWRGPLTAVVALLLTAPPLHAQLQPPSPTGRVSIAPFVGARIPFTTDRTYSFVDGDEQFDLNFTEEHGGGFAAGTELAVRVTGAFSLVGGFAFSRSGDVYATDLDSEEGDVYVQKYKPTLWFARAGVSVRLPEPVVDERRFRSVAHVWLGPALVRETFSKTADLPAYFTQPVNSWAINVGAKAVAPLGGSRFAFNLALEDYVTFWNRSTWRTRFDRLMEDETGAPVTSRVDYPVSNVLLARAGVSFTF